MLTIEDLLEELESLVNDTRMYSYKRLASNPITSPADRKFLQDLSARTRSGGKFSTKQAAIACKIISKYATLFSLHEKNNMPADKIISLCNSPIYRQAPYLSTDVPREVRYLGNRKLGFKCKFAPQIIDKIKSLKDPIGGTEKPWPKFNKKYKIWVVEVTENNLEKIMQIIKKFSFNFDDDVVQFLTDCENSKEKISTAVADTTSINVIVQNNNLLASWLDEIILVEELLNV